MIMTEGKVKLGVQNGGPTERRGEFSPAGKDEDANGATTYIKYQSSMLNRNQSHQSNPGVLGEVLQNFFTKIIKKSKIIKISQNHIKKG